MKPLLLSFALTLCLFAGAAGAHVASGGATAAAAHAATSIVGVPMDIDFRCFLCDWYGCAISNVGGLGCDENASSCRVVDWGCSEWPSGGLIAIRW